MKEVGKEKSHAPTKDNGVTLRKGHHSQPLTLQNGNECKSPEPPILEAYTPTLKDKLEKSFGAVEERAMPFINQDQSGSISNPTDNLVDSESEEDVKYILFEEGNKWQEIQKEGVLDVVEKLATYPEGILKMKDSSSEGSQDESTGPEKKVVHFSERFIICYFPSETYDNCRKRKIPNYSNRILKKLKRMGSGFISKNKINIQGAGNPTTDPSINVVVKGVKIEESTQLQPQPPVATVPGPPPDPSLSIVPEVPAVQELEVPITTPLALLALPKPSTSDSATPIVVFTKEPPKRQDTPISEAKAFEAKKKGKFFGKRRLFNLAPSTTTTTSSTDAATNKGKESPKKKRTRKRSSGERRSERVLRSRTILVGGAAKSNGEASKGLLYELLDGRKITKAKKRMLRTSEIKTEVEEKAPEDIPKAAENVEENNKEMMELPLPTPIRPNEGGGNGEALSEPPLIEPPVEPIAESPIVETQHDNNEAMTEEKENIDPVASTKFMDSTIEQMEIIPETDPEIPSNPGQTEGLVQQPSTSTTSTNTDTVASGNAMNFEVNVQDRSETHFSKNLPSLLLQHAIELNPDILTDLVLERYPTSKDLNIFWMNTLNKKYK